MADPIAGGGDATTQGRRPSDTEELVGETAASQPLTSPDHAVQPPETESRSARTPHSIGAEDDEAEEELGHS